MAKRIQMHFMSSFRYNVADGSWTELPVTLPTYMAHPSAMYVDICHDPWWPRIGRKFDGECGNFSGFNYRTSVLRTLPFMIVNTFQKFDSYRRCEWPGSYRTNELFCSLFSLTLTFHDEIGGSGRVEATIFHLLQYFNDPFLLLAAVLPVLELSFNVKSHHS